MGQLIELQAYRQAARLSAEPQRDTLTGKPEKPAQVLFFTGVRYERPASSPSERLKALASTKHSV